MTAAPAPAAAAPRPRPTPLPPPVRRGVVASLAGVAAAVVGAVLARWLPRPVLLVWLVPLQVLVALCWLTLAAVPARFAGTTVAAGGGLVGAIVLSLQHRATLGALAGVIGLGVVAAVVAQLFRREREQLTDTLAAQCAGLLLTAGVASLAAVRGSRDGAVAAGLGLAALAAGQLVGTLVDAAGRRAAIGPAFRGRSLVGAVATVGVAAGLGALLRAGDGAVLGVVAGVVAVLGDATVAVAAGPRRIGRPLAVLLPYALVGPGLYVATRVLLG